ncbi:MAG: GAF domain-containing protein [Acidobacteriia bacterium]|nr:GAF domain-containing protein [Terriglobia bacterium]
MAPKPRLASRGRLPLREIRGAQNPKSPLDAVAGLLQSSRQYFAVTIYLATGEGLLRVASAGPAPRCDCMRVGEGNVGEAAKTGRAKVVPDVSRDPQYFQVFRETRSELVTPIKIGTHVIGVMDVESDRRNASAYEERVLLYEVASVLAQFLSGRGKYLVMQSGHPQTERQVPLRPAAGDRVRS